MPGCILEREEMDIRADNDRRSLSSSFSADSSRLSTIACDTGNDTEVPCPVPPQDAMETGSTRASPEKYQATRKKASKYLIVASLLFVVGLAALAVVFRDDLRTFHQYSYPGAFIISVMSGGTIIVPIPGIPVIFALGGIVPYPFLVGLAAGLGEALGAFTFYVGGRGGQSMLTEKQRNSGVYTRLDRWMTSRGSLTLFVASAIFNPVFSVISAMAGATRFPAWKFYVACAAGKTVKGMYVAYLGAWGLGHVLGWFGISLD